MGRGSKKKNAPAPAPTHAVAGVRCIAVAVADGMPLVVVAVDVARRAVDAPTAARLALKAILERENAPPGDDGGFRLEEMHGGPVYATADRLAIGGRLVPAFLVVSPGDVGAVPLIVETKDLRQPPSSDPRA